MNSMNDSNDWNAFWLRNEKEWHKISKQKWIWKWEKSWIQWECKKGAEERKEAQKTRENCSDKHFEIDECALCVMYIQTRSMRLCLLLYSIMCTKKIERTHKHARETNEKETHTAQTTKMMTTTTTETNEHREEINVRCVDEKSYASNGHYSTTFHGGKTFQIITQDVK